MFFTKDYSELILLLYIKYFFSFFVCLEEEAYKRIIRNSYWYRTKVTFKVNDMLRQIPR